MQNDLDWLDICDADDIDSEDIIRWDHAGKSFAIYRTEEDTYHATDNICTHELAYLSDGFLEGTTIECPRHAGCFDIRTGEALNPPACKNLKAYPVKVEDGRVLIGFSKTEVVSG